MKTSQLFIDHALEIADFMVATELSVGRRRGVELVDAHTLLRSRNVFALPWTNGNGKQVKLCP